MMDGFALKFRVRTFHLCETIWVQIDTKELKVQTWPMNGRLQTCRTLSTAAFTTVPWVEPLNKVQLAHEANEGAKPSTTMLQPAEAALPEPFLKCKKQPEVEVFREFMLKNML